ncbi:MAG: hypothetical protein RIS47_391 [Bacteroidota bacterium]
MGSGLELEVNEGLEFAGADLVYGKYCYYDYGEFCPNWAVYEPVLVAGFGF